jgi:cell division protein FtsA
MSFQIKAYEVFKMELSNINPKDIIFALDIGTRSIIGTAGIVREKKFNSLAECYLEHEERAMMDGQIHDINLVADGVNKVKNQLEKDLGFKLKDVSIAAAGRFLRTTLAKAEIKLDQDREIDKDLIRSLELSAVKEAEGDVKSHTEGKMYCVGYSVKNYYLNDYVISNLLSHKGDKIAVDVIATFLPRSVVESLYAVMDKVGLNIISMTLEPIAAMEAAVPKSLRLLNLALIDIGAGTSDIAISSKDSISAYGMVATAGDEVTEAIAQSFLVDFNTAERIKRECSINDSVLFTDVLGFENQVSSEEILKVIVPVVHKLCEEIASKIIELNGGKTPNAVFLVGGGAHTPYLKEILGEKLKLPAQRIAIKGREAVADCICMDNGLGSIGVTVLGIALVSIMKLGNDFIDVTLNGKVVSLFNSHKHTVADVMIQAGINPKVLIGRNGKNIKFSLNSSKRIAFGSMAVNAEIRINNVVSGIDSEVKEGDNIHIDFAVDGRDAAPKVIDFIQNVDATSIYVDDKLVYMDPVVFIEENKVDLETLIKDGDEIKIIYPKTLGDFKKYIETDVSNGYILEGREVEESYIFKEGDRIYRKIKEEKPEAVIDETEQLKAKNIIYQPENIELHVVINGEKVCLKGKDKYIFIDIFDFIDFDLTVAKGNLVLLVNGNRAAYHDVLSADDKIKIYWE